MKLVVYIITNDQYGAIVAMQVWDQFYNYNNSLINLAKEGRSASGYPAIWCIHASVNKGDKDDGRRTVTHNHLKGIYH